ncbi:MAG: 7-carboxy-7-deazaguanine synthase QueE [Methylacidiphilales bacterium]|nr:7-carboxy-7-deazaguanine synthase QueE [Candidatus Methylacidiphilales bacterium]MDW8348823.1 7-carboxy-7-deazaguanine synthase QueE [Verrucomicrobiae bacterium]
MPTPELAKPIDSLQLRINEIFYSIQGESTYAGQPCVFVRLTGCDLRCTYCDTQYAFYEGERQTISQILATIAQYNCRLVEITGGEPLLQHNVIPLMSLLCDLGYKVLIETSGAHDISQIDPRVERIMDLKCPSSGEVERNLWSNIAHLKSHDEVKFVIGTQDDYEWAKEKLFEYHLHVRVRAVLFSPVFETMKPVTLATAILRDQLPVRFQIQLHKIIWPSATRGV